MTAINNPHYLYEESMIPTDQLQRRCTHMNTRKMTFLGVATISLYSFLMTGPRANEIGVGRDGDNPGAQSPVEAEAMQDVCLWQAILEWFELATDQ